MYFIYFVFVQVIPPIEFRQIVSKAVPNDKKLTIVVQQNSTKINYGQLAVYNLWYKGFTEMKFFDYEKLAIEAEIPYFGMSPKQREDAYWQNISKRSRNAMPKFIPIYAIDNDFSLFPESYTHWNLNEFTGLKSIIHMVCISVVYHSSV